MEYGCIHLFQCSTTKPFPPLILQQNKYYFFLFLGPTAEDLYKALSLPYRANKHLLNYTLLKISAKNIFLWYDGYCQWIMSIIGIHVHCKHISNLSFNNLNKNTGAKKLEVWSVFPQNNVRQF